MGDQPLALYGPYGPCVLNCGSQTTRTSSASIDPTTVNSYRLLVVDAGSLRIDAPGQRVERLPPGSASLVVPGTGAPLRLAPRSALRFVVFDLVHHPRRGSPGRLVHESPTTPQPDPRRVWGVDIPGRLPPVASAAAHELCGLIRGEYWRGVLEHARASARLSLWLADLVIALRSGSDTESRSTDPFEAAEQYVRRQAPHLPTVRDLASWCGMSREHFARAFKRARGISPSDFLDNERWQQAQRLLIDTDDNLIEIGRRLGYQQLPAFSRAFRRRFACSPRNYRRQYRRDR